MDALDEETKDNILRNIGELFPDVSDLSFFRQIFDSENWDLEKSLSAIKNLLEYVDEGTLDNGSAPNNNTTKRSPSPVFPSLVPPSTTMPTMGRSDPPSGSSTSARNSAPTLPTMSYSSSAKSGAVPKPPATEKKAPPTSKALRREKLLKAYNDGLKQKNPVLRLKYFALEGIKVMIIMRGCPGSGKTYLVQHLANSLSSEQSKALGWSTVHPVDHHIFSADDFWINPSGKYVFNSEYIEYAHRWNQKIVRQAACEGRSPIFVDNTHTRLWEMQAVATIAVEYGYVIEIIDTREVNKNALNVNELVRRNVHGVHYDAIKRMVERYEVHIQPKHLFKAYSLTYHPNASPPQRCLVTFNTPASKNQMKIFNTRFHFAPLKDILALKSEPGADNTLNVGNRTKSALQSERTSSAIPEKDPRNPFVFNATTFDVSPSRLSDSSAEFFPNTGNYRAPYPSQFQWFAPPSQGNPIMSVNHTYNPQQSVQNSWFSENQYHPGSTMQSVPLVSPAEYIWSGPASTDANLAAGASDTVDPLLSVNEEIGNTSLNQPLVPSKNSNIHDKGAVGSRNGIASSKSESTSDLLLSFDELSQGTSKSSSSSHVNHLHGSEYEPTTNLRVSPCKAVDPEDESDNSDFSGEDIPMTLPSNACNEFGHQVTSEYVLVQSDGSLKFQNSHERLPISLKEFIATSKMEIIKKKLAKSVSRNDSGSTVNKFMKPFLKTVSNVPMYSNDELLLNGVTISEPVSTAACADTSRQALSTAEIVSSEQSTSSPNSPGRGSLVGVTVSNQSRKDSEHKNYNADGITPQDFIDQIWRNGTFREEAQNSASRPGSGAKTSTSEAIAPIVASSWIEEKEPEPVRISRSDSPKGQRSQFERSLTKKCDKGTDANYFEIVSKAEAVGNNDVILFGNATSFQSSPSPPKQDGIKVVATHEKSSMTKGDESADEIDSGVEILTKMFPGVSQDCLVDLFEKCQKNLYWTANLLMDSGVEISENFNAEVAPPKEFSPPSTSPHLVETASEPSSKESLTAPPSVKKLKKNRHKLTEEYLDLVKEFEGSFILSGDHYSETLKKVRETKFGRPLEPAEDPSTSRDASPPNDPESCSSDIWDDDEGDMSLVVSNDLIGQLQNKFGPIPNIYGREMVIKLPVSLARQVYSYALESIFQQVEDEQNLFDILVKEDEAFARKLQEESDDSRGDMSFQEIMDHEMALRAHEREQGQASSASSETFASRLSLQLLAERFPNMDSVTLQKVLDVTNQSLHEATNLLASAGHVPVDPAVQEAAKSVETEPSYTMSREESIEQANAYHEVASKLNDMRQLYFQKAKEAYNNGNHAVALFYRELFTWYSDQIKTSNAKAAKAMLHGNEGATTLDLHYLHVSEAVAVLDLFLDESIRQLSSRKMEIFIITGRGLHSLDGKSRLKPAIKLRLKQRALRFCEINPGMLKTVITKSSTVSYKLNGVQ